MADNGFLISSENDEKSARILRDLIFDKYPMSHTTVFIKDKNKKTLLEDLFYTKNKISYEQFTDDFIHKKRITQLEISPVIREISLKDTLLCILYIQERSLEEEFEYISHSVNYFIKKIDLYKNASQYRFQDKSLMLNEIALLIYHAGLKPAHLEEWYAAFDNINALIRYYISYPKTMDLILYRPNFNDFNLIRKICTLIKNSHYFNMKIIIITGTEFPYLTLYSTGMGTFFFATRASRRNEYSIAQLSDISLFSKYMDEFDDRTSVIMLKFIASSIFIEKYRYGY